MAAFYSSSGMHQTDKAKILIGWTDGFQAPQEEWASRSQLFAYHKPAFQPLGTKPRKEDWGSVIPFWNTEEANLYSQPEDGLERYL